MHVDNNQSMILKFAVKIYKKQRRQKSNGGNGGVRRLCIRLPCVTPPITLIKDKKNNNHDYLVVWISYLNRVTNVTDSLEILNRQGIYNKQISEKANEIKTCFLACFDREGICLQRIFKLGREIGYKSMFFFHSPTFRRKFSFSLSVW